MKESKDKFIERKKIAIEQLKEKAKNIIEQLKSDPEYEDAMKDRIDKIERGELWITQAAIKYSQLFMQLAMINSEINSIRSTAFNNTNTYNKEDTQNETTRTLTIKSTRK